jgi:hypothetical protein
MAFKKRVTVTVPELDIEQKDAFLVKEAPARFSVWWEPATGSMTKHTDPDISVPNEMIIVEY